MGIQQKLLRGLLTTAFLVASPILVRAQYSANQTSDSQTFIGANTAGAGDSNDSFTITNSTGTAWTDYSFVVGPPSGYGSTNNESYFTSCTGGTLSYAIAPGDSALNTGIYYNDCTLDVSVASGSSFEVTLGIGAGEPGWSVDGTPSLGSTTTTPPPSTTPEPGTMLLLGSGLIGLAGGLRRKFKI